MLNEPTLDKLKALKLDAFAVAWLEQHKTPEMSKVPFDERLGLLVDAECLARENRRLARLLKEAKLKIAGACVEDIDYPAKRQLDKAVIRQLATCRWIAEHQHVCVTGATGTGKTFLACALAQQACRRGYRALYFRASRLFEELRLSHAGGTYARLLGKLCDVERASFRLAGFHHGRVRVWNPWAGLYFLRAFARGHRRQPQSGDTSQLPTEQWHEHIGEPMTADAICDRLLSSAHKIRIKGPSRRRPGGEDEA